MNTERFSDLTSIWAETSQINFVAGMATTYLRPGCRNRHHDFLQQNPLQAEAPRDVNAGPSAIYGIPMRMEADEEENRCMDVNMCVVRWPDVDTLQNGFEGKRRNYEVTEDDAGRRNCPIMIAVTTGVVVNANLNSMG